MAEQRRMQDEQYVRFATDRRLTGRKWTTEDMPGRISGRNEPAGRRYCITSYVTILKSISFLAHDLNKSNPRPFGTIDLTSH
jgi:hypothetical protein